MQFRSTEAAKEHWRNHEQQEQITDNYYISVEENEQPNPCPSSCPYQTRKRHYHCCWVRIDIYYKCYKIEMA